MKVLPKQSVCPHCETIYRYSDLNKIKFKKSTECYHCGKALRVSRMSLWILAAELIVIYAILNVIALGVMDIFSFLALYIMNIIPILAAVFIAPMYIEIIKIKNRKKRKKDSE